MFIDCTDMQNPTIYRYFHYLLVRERSGCHITSKYPLIDKSIIIREL